MAHHGTGQADTDPAVRVDSKLGIRDRVEFLGSGPDRVAAARHEPLVGDPMGALVICPSICNDFTKNYRREVTLGRELATRGIVVQRFHYRGTGNSDGDAAHLTVSTMVEDTLTAAGRAQGIDEPLPLVFMGTRFGALPAAIAAGRQPDVPLVLVDPTVEARQFFREAWRAKMSRELKDDTAESLAAQSLEDQLALQGSIDVLGNAIHRALYESATQCQLVDAIDGPARRFLLVQLGAATKGLRPGNADLVAHLKSHGHRVDVEIVGDLQTWWFLDDSTDTLTELVPTIADWVANAFRDGLHHG